MTLVFNERLYFCLYVGILEKNLLKWIIIMSALM